MKKLPILTAITEIELSSMMSDHGACPFGHHTPNGTTNRNSESPRRRCPIVEWRQRAMSLAKSLWAQCRGWKDRNAKIYQREEARARALLELSQMAECKPDDIAGFTLENVITLTNSAIGYIAMVNDDETVLTLQCFSKSVMQECEVAGPFVYPVKQTGLWGETVRQRKTIVTNDYAAANPYKKGLPEGHVRLTRHVGVPIFDGEKIVAVVGVGNKPTDYTDEDVRQVTLMMDCMWRLLCRKRAEQALRENEEKLRTLIANVPAAVYQLYARPNGEIGLYYIDGRFVEVAGAMPKDEDLFSFLMQTMEPEDRQNFLDSTMNAIAEVKPWSYEGKFHTPAGDIRWFSGVSTPMQRENEIVFNGVLFDITQRKLGEEELMRYANALEATNKQLEEAKREAEAANRIKSEFLANVSHEIRTPMTAILGYADILLENVRDPQCIDAADTIRRNGHYLLDIINNILDLSKIEANRVQIDQTSCSPVNCVGEVVSLMRVRAESKNLTLSAEFEGPIPQTIRSDPARLRQILLNLVGNAIKFTESGSVRIVTRLFQEEGKPPMLQGNVIDTGIGMSDEQIARVFEPFTQADASTSRRFGGSGLGLTISKRLANLLGGDIAVHSKLGEGATFTLTVATGPLDGVATIVDASKSLLEKHRQEPPVVNIPKLDGVRVLLAEDGPDNQRLIAFFLRKAGVKVSVAENGQAAIDTITNSPSWSQSGGVESPFDVVLMDMQMPVLDGYEATQQLRKLGYRGPIIALTAHAMSQDREQCLDAGCDDYLAKPIEQGSLIETVARYSPTSCGQASGDDS